MNQTDYDINYGILEGWPSESTVNMFWSSQTGQFLLPLNERNEPAAKNAAEPLLSLSACDFLTSIFVSHWG